MRSLVRVIPREGQRALATLGAVQGRVGPGAPCFDDMNQALHKRLHLRYGRRKRVSMVRDRSPAALIKGPAQLRPETCASAEFERFLASNYVKYHYSGNRFFCSAV